MNRRAFFEFLALLAASFAGWLGFLRPSTKVYFTDLEVHFLRDLVGSWDFVDGVPRILTYMSGEPRAENLWECTFRFDKAPAFPEIYHREHFPEKILKAGVFA